MGLATAPNFKMNIVNDIRSLIFTEVRKLQERKTTPQTFNAIRGGMALVLTSVKLELEFAKVMQKNPNMQFFEVPVDSAEPEVTEEAA